MGPAVQAHLDEQRPLADAHLWLSRADLHSRRRAASTAGECMHGTCEPWCSRSSRSALKHLPQPILQLLDWVPVAFLYQALPRRPILACTATSACELHSIAANACLTYAVHLQLRCTVSHQHRLGSRREGLLGELL